MAINSETEQITLNNGCEITVVQVLVVLFNQFQCFLQLHHCRHLVLAGVAAGAIADQVADLAVAAAKFHNVVLTALHNGDALFVFNAKNFS